MNHAWQVAVAMTIAGCSGQSRPAAPAEPAASPPPGFVCPSGMALHWIHDEAHAWVCGRAHDVAGEEVYTCVAPHDHSMVQTGPVAWMRAGRTHIEGTCVHDVEDGRWTSYYEDGTLHSESQLDMGVSNGIGRMYYPDGKVMSEGETHEGRVLWSRQYDETGTLVREYQAEED